jgi:hypothetical protein
MSLSITMYVGAARSPLSMQVRLWHPMHIVIAVL